MIPAAIGRGRGAFDSEYILPYFWKVVFLSLRCSPLENDVLGLNISSENHLNSI